ncbi:hypothetical protein C8R41DRAFT_921410 [Lentinula lateritia]|uniref:Uncharacterized protein n=1 Tax=Lentinula lateritia TaxID=40482 RepID=A0ABQ8VBY1_9AGAR|nr:hypothetical protein C8R41DRAFT_927102 [Lentinula lateritia]KAJ4485100.1 hypothetical protein C8R41DRAFT_921410 [Lentinula lateritia]
MSSKVRILSSDTQQLRLLERQVEEKRREILQLRSEVQELQQQLESPNRKTPEVDIGLEPKHQHSLSRLERAIAMNLSFRTQILASLDCDLNDSKSIDAISSDDSKQFWSLLQQVKSSRAEVVISEALMLSPGADNVEDELLKDSTASYDSGNLTALIVEQCLVLCDMAGKLKGTGYEDVLFQECTDLYHRAQYL